MVVCEVDYILLHQFRERQDPDNPTLPYLSNHREAAAIMLCHPTRTTTLTSPGHKNS